MIYTGIYYACSAFLGILDKDPKTWAGKLILLAHGWFVLIVMASYTANLAAFLTASLSYSGISSWADIVAGQDRFVLGVPNSRTHFAFLDAQGVLYGHNYTFNVTSTWEDALALLREGRVDAVFHDQALIQNYLADNFATRGCEMAETGKLFYQFG